MKMPHDIGAKVAGLVLATAVVAAATAPAVTVTAKARHDAMHQGQTK